MQSCDLIKQKHRLDLPHAMAVRTVILVAFQGACVEETRVRTPNPGDDHLPRVKLTDFQPKLQE